MMCYRVRVGIIHTPVICIALILSMLVFLQSCTGINVSSGYDTRANFKAYHTYAFTSGLRRSSLSRHDKQYIAGAICAELELRGYDMADPVDLLVDVQVKSKQRGKQVSSDRTTVEDPDVVKYQVGEEFMNASNDLDRLKDGTMIINIVDNHERKLIWRGIGISTLDQKGIGEIREANINYAIAMIFRNYPISVTKH